MAINDIGEQAMAAQKAREANLRRVQQQTLPVSNPSARAAGNVAAGIADRIPQGPATQPPSPALQGQGANIASRPAAGPASSIASQKPVMQSPVDRDFAQARAEQAARFDAPKPAAASAAAPASTGRVGAVVDKVRSIGQIPVGQAAKSVASAVPAAARSVASGAAKLAKGNAYVAPAIGAAQTFMQPETAQRDFEDSVGVESPVGAAVAGVGRLATNIGNAVTFGQAERVGRGLSSLAGGAGFMEGYREPTTADRADMNAARDQAAAQPQAQPQAEQPQSGIAAIPQAQPQQERSLGTFNGKPITQSMIDDAGSRVNVADSVPQQPQNNAKSITDSLLGRMDSQDATFTNLVKGNLGRRDGRAERSEERLNKLQGMFETAMFQGKRRTAAIIAQAMQAEGSNLSTLSGGNIPDVRRNTPIDPNAAANEGKIAAEAGESEARANKDRVETSRQQRINDVMGAFLDDPNSEAGQQAARNLQTINGKQSDRLYPVDVQVGTDATGAPVMGKGLFDPNGGGLEYSPNGQGIAGGIQQGGAQLPEGAATLAGYDRKTGKPVYLDAQGNQVIEE